MIICQASRPNREIAERARCHFDRAINMEPNRAMIAYYYRAYCLIIEGGETKNKEALVALKRARDLLSTEKEEIMRSYLLQT